MIRFITEKKLFIYVLFVKISVILAVLYIFGLERFLWSDSTEYFKIGTGIFNGEGYNNPFRTPLYPFLLGFFLWISEYGVLATVAFQAIIASLSAVLLYKIALFFVSSRYAVLTALLFAFEPLLVILNVLILPETILGFFLLLFAFLFIKYLNKNDLKLLVLSIFALAAAVWVKPVASFLYIVPVILLIFIRRNIKDAVIVFVIFYLLVMPWMIFNFATFGEFNVSAHGDPSVCGYLLTSVFSTEYGQDPSDMSEDIFPPNFIEAKNQCSGIFSGISIAILNYPLSFAKTMFLSSLSLITNEGYSVLFQDESDLSKVHNNYLTPVVFADSDWGNKIKSAYSDLGLAEFTVIILGKIFWVLTFIFGIYGFTLLLKREKNKAPVYFLMFIILYFIAVTVISTGYGVSARLRYPAVPFLFILAAVGTESVVRNYRAISKKLIARV